MNSRSTYQVDGVKSFLGLAPGPDATLRGGGALMEDDYDEEITDADSKSFFEDVDEAVTLNRTERMYGFVICFVLGWLISMASVSTLATVVINPSRFAALYSLGNIVSLCSTMFLWGPVKQIKSMFEEVRRGATLVYLASIAFTLFAAFRMHSMPLVVAAMAVQFVRTPCPGRLGSQGSPPRTHSPVPPASLTLPLPLPPPPRRQCAMVWYCASFIPWGREILSRLVCGVCSCCLTDNGL